MSPGNISCLCISGRSTSKHVDLIVKGSCTKSQFPVCRTCGHIKCCRDENHPCTVQYHCAGKLREADVVADDAAAFDAVHIKEAGLFTWDKPAYACLATRIPAGEKITAEKLKAIEESEAVLFSMGFSDFRVRLRDGGALLQFTEEQQRRAQEMLGEITTELLKHFETIKIDLKAREKSK